MAITEEGITDTKTLARWLRSIADDVEKRGLELDSLNGFAAVGTTEMTGEGDVVRHFSATRDYFLALNWRFADRAGG